MIFPFLGAADAALGRSNAVSITTASIVGSHFLRMSYLLHLRAAVSPGLHHTSVIAGAAVDKAIIPQVGRIAKSVESWDPSRVQLAGTGTKMPSSAAFPSQKASLVIDLSPKPTEGVDH
jgi:hypothetical protein